MESKAFWHILYKKRTMEILTALYLEKRATSYRIAKKINTDYRSVHRRLKELEATRMICCQSVEVRGGRVNKFYSFTPEGEKVFIEFLSRRIKTLLKLALDLGLNPHRLLEEVSR
jgi:predicted ArsR family transcriptional regulator